MTTINFKSAGISARVINLTGPTAIQPIGVPAGVIGTSLKGPAYVPTTVATTQDFVNIFGEPVDGRANAPLAVSEWLRNQQAATFLRVLGAGQGRKRESSGDNAGKVAGAGFVVGNEQPQEPGGGLGGNSNAVSNGPLGRLYFLCTFMSESAGSGLLSDAGLLGSGTPLVRAVLMAASGVVPTLSSAKAADSSAPSSTTAADTANKGAVTGSVNLNDGRQEFVLLLNGHKGTDLSFPNVVTASFDFDAPNYLGRQLNSDPLKLEDAGYVLYTHYSMHPDLAVVTGSGIVSASNPGMPSGFENIALIVSGAVGRNTGSTTAPSYENFEDRYRTPASTYVLSQKFGGKPVNLFRIHALTDGAQPNNKLKWSIENISPSNSDVNPYGTFDLLVRDFSDTDKNKVTLEAWRGLSLNPSAESYIARVIGDQYTFFNFDAEEGSQKLVSTGDFANRSSFIRVEVTDAVKNAEVDSSALPVGFRGVAHLVTSGSAPLAQAAALGDPTYYATGSRGNLAQHVVQMPIPFRENITVGAVTARTVDKGLYWGVQFERKIDVDEKNSTTESEQSIQGFTVYLPDFQNDFLDVEVQGNEGAADSAATGILDADRFNNNLFSLERVQVKYDVDADLADVTQLVSWSYVRNGSISTNTSSATRALKVSDLSDASVRSVAKFSGLIHGGFDGTRIFNENTLNLTNTAVVEEMENTNRGTSNGATVKAYDKALDIISDATEVDVQLLTIPGIRHPIVTDKALLTTEQRFDAMYIMDVEEYDTSNLLVTSSGQTLSVRFTANNHRDRGLNNSFGAAYFPDVIIRDEINGTVRQVPPSVAVLGAFSLNDAVGFPWFAPAGFTRGALQTTEEAIIPLSRDNLDSLQDVDINPLVSFAGSEGPVVWGQRTLLARDSALERVNVRRLLIEVRRQVQRVARRIVFEQGRPETLARFSSLVNPILKRIQDQRGLERFLVRIDTTTTTQADIENKTIRGRIFLIPTKTLEFISIDFTVTNQGNFVTAVGT